MRIYYETKGGDSRECESVGQIKAELESEGRVVSDEWDDYGADDRRMLVWAYEEDAKDNWGAKAIGQIVEVSEEVER